MSTNNVVRKTTVLILKLLCLPISAVMGLFCNSILPPAPEYGMPHADYKVSGTVLSSDENVPVKGLMVSIRDTINVSRNIDSAKTDSSGRYTLQFSQGAWDHTWELTVKDIDSTENGSFLAKDTVISIQSSELKDPDGNWYNGHAEKNIDLKVDRQN